MKMPAGYRIWIDSFTAEHPENEFGKEQRFIAGLMKEMAEALDDMVSACNKGYGRDIQKMERALEKFKEWK